MINKKYIFGLFVLLFLFTNVYSDVTDGLVAGYHFTDSGNTSFTINGATGTTGKINQAYSFDGNDDYIEETSLSTNNENKTISLWVNFNNINTQQEIIMSGDKNSFGIRMKDGNDGNIDGQLTLRVLNNYVRISNINKNTWYNIVFIMKSGNIQTYLNGILEDSNSATYTLDTFTGLDIGRYFSSTAYFSGKIDDVRIYNYTLTSTEISNLYNSGSGTEIENIKPSNLIFHSNMNSGYDFSNNNNYLTINGATTTIDKNNVSNHAYSFDGNDDYIDTNYQTTISQNSFCMWIKKDQTNYPPATSEHDFFGAQDSTPHYWKSGFHSSYPDKLMYAYANDNSNYELKYGTTTIDTNWHFVCYTVNGTSIKVYLDGVEETMNPMSNGGSISSLTVTNNYGIGKTIPNANSEFDGKIDEFRIYNKTLTSTEITDLYNNYDYATTTSNFTITAENIYDSSTIDDFNVSIVGDSYSQSFSSINGSITTNILNNDTSLYNITFVSSGYYSNTSYNVNVSSNLNKALKSLPPTNFSITTPNPFDKYTSIININWTSSTSPVNSNITYSIKLYNSSMDFMNNITNDISSTNYTYNTSNDINFTGDYIIQIIAKDKFNINNTQTNNFTISPDYDYLKVIVNDYLGNQITTALTYWDSIINRSLTPSNPYQVSISNYLDKEVQINVTDILHKHQTFSQKYNITRHSHIINITLEPNQLMLYFWNDTTLKTTKGYVTNNNTRYKEFDNSSIVVIQQSLDIGNVFVFLNTINGTDYKQYYQYYNDYGTHISENILLINNSDHRIFFKVTDRNGFARDGATVRISIARYNPNNDVQYKLIGQKLTSIDGLVDFYTENDSMISIRVTQSGFEPKTIILDPETLTDNNYLNPYIIPLSIADTTTPRANFMMNRKNYFNYNETIYGEIVAYGYTHISINTDYRERLNLPPKDITQNKLSKWETIYSFKLDPITDYNNTYGNTTIDVYLDQEFWKSFTIRQVDMNSDEKSSIFNNLPFNATTNSDILLLIGLIMVSFVIGYSFTNGSAGLHSFMIGSIILSFFSSKIWVIGIISAVYYASLLYKGVYQE